MQVQYIEIHVIYCYIWTFNTKFSTSQKYEDPSNTSSPVKTAYVKKKS